MKIQAPTSAPKSMAVKMWKINPGIFMSKNAPKIRSMFTPPKHRNSLFLLDLMQQMKLFPAKTVSPYILVSSAL